MSSSSITCRATEHSWRQGQTRAAQAAHSLSRSPLLHRRKVGMPERAQAYPFLRAAADRTSVRSVPVSAGCDSMCLAAGDTASRSGHAC
ncbi:hypothetical protein CO2235_MP20217 [Cupriavidus oxalaticus]|uniref:Uncharacterized protein n=1 Tax=Cupriavidus oxalaticus TaxID=96344 RepID=A0A976GCK0_9BURK|nr:hypothetical protein CO2235_MP20217 [Cupriavidus oxalaticus]